MIKPISLAAVTAALLAGAPAWAATPATLEQAVRLASAHNLEAQLADEQALAATAARDQAGSAFWPQLSARGRGVYRDLSYPTAFASQPGLFPALVASGMAPGANLDLGIEARQLLFDGFASQLRHDAASNQARAAAFSASDRRLAVELETAGAYLDVLAADKRRQTAQRELARAEAMARLAADRLKRGQGTRREQLEAQARLAGAEGAIAPAQLAYEATWAELSRLTGDRLATGPLAEPPELPPLAVPTAELETRLAAQPGVQALEAQAQAARAQAEAASRAQWPKVALEGRYDRLATYDLGAAAVGVGVEWPLFDGWRSARAADQAASGARQAALAAALGRQGRLRAIRLAYPAWQQAREQRRAAAAAAEAAQASAHTALKRFEVGMGTQAEAIAAEAALLGAEHALIEARYGEIKAQLKLANALGLSIGDWLAAARP